MLIHSLSAVFSASSSCLTCSCTRFVARTPKTWWYQQWSFLADGDLLRLDSDFRLSFCSDLSRERDLTRFETSRFSSSTFLLWCLCRLVANYHVSKIYCKFFWRQVHFANESSCRHSKWFVQKTRKSFSDILPSACRLAYRAGALMVFGLQVLFASSTDEFDCFYCCSSYGLIVFSKFRIYLLVAAFLYVRY